MNTFVIVFIPVLVLVGFAIYKKDCVRASFRLCSFGFFLEAKNNRVIAKRQISVPENRTGSTDATR